MQRYGQQGVDVPRQCGNDSDENRTERGRIVESAMKLQRLERSIDREGVAKSGGDRFERGWVELARRTASGRHGLCVQRLGTTRAVWPQPRQIVSAAGATQRFGGRAFGTAKNTQSRHNRLQKTPAAAANAIDGSACWNTPGHPLILCATGRASRLSLLSGSSTKLLTCGR